MLNDSRTLNLESFAGELRTMGVDPSTLDLSRAAEACGQLLVEESHRSIAESRDVETGNPFAPLTVRTLRRKRARGYPDTALRGSGRMERSLAAQVSGNTVMVTADDPAGYHLEGTRTMPARPFIGAGEDALRRCEEVVAEEVVKQLGLG